MIDVNRIFTAVLGLIFLFTPTVFVGQTSGGGAGGGGGANPVLKPTNVLYVFGDSYLFGAGATSVQTGIFALLARDTPAPAGNSAVNGTTAPLIANSGFLQFIPHPAIPSTTLMDGGANSDDGCGGTAGTVCVTNFKNIMSALEAWVSIPTQFRIMASAATASGTWSTDTTLPIAAPLYASPGTPRKTSVNGATLTFNVPSSASPAIGITTIVTNSQTGTFTVSIDGSLKTDACTGTTTWTSATCATIGGGITSTFARQRFSVTPGTTHTVVVTSTAAANSSVVSVDWVPLVGTTNANAVFVAGVDAVFGTVYDTASKAVATQLAADGLSVFFVDLQHGTPGVNATTDISTTATATCPASTIANHPNDCGYRNLLLTLNAAEAANNYVFSSFGAGGQTAAITGQMFGPIRVPGGITTRASAYSDLSSSSGTNEVGFDWYRSGQFFGQGFGQDAGTGSPFSGSFMSRTYGSFGWNCNQLYDNTGLYGMAHYTSTACWEYATGRGYQLGSQTAKYFAALQGTAIASASTIAPTSGTTHITGTTPIDTVTPPANCITGTSCEIKLIPDAVWTTTTAGNIALATTTVVVGKALIMTYDATTTKWYPSY